MTAQERKPTNDLFISDEFYRQALRNFADAGNAESEQNEGDNDVPGAIFVSDESDRLS